MSIPVDSSGLTTARNCRNSEKNPTTMPVCPMRDPGLITRRSLVQIQPPQLRS